MRLTKTIAAVTAATFAATTAMAGGLAPAAPETTVVVPVEPAPQRSSWGIILPILGVALLIGLANKKDDNGTSGPSMCDDPNSETTPPEQIPCEDIG
ncbi:MAG: hypothetical protein H3C51_00120 [Rubellimicrobium sp.]|nr:hypothetical protein [Rubellimicrobium sp.]